MFHTEDIAPATATHLACFKAYDIRGRVPDELNPELAFRLGLAYAQLFAPSRIALGRDVRVSSETLLRALALGLNRGGADVLDIGLCGTEEVYFASTQPGVDGGIMVTASHNPRDYNGMKLVRGGAVPVSGDSGLRELEALVAKSTARYDGAAPSMTTTSFRDAYVRHLLGYVDVAALRPLKIVVNAGNGSAGLVVDALAGHLPFEFARVHHEPDGSFPNGIPNPLLPENRDATASAVIAHGADFGIAWDGDFDRCFLFDAQGNFIEGYYIVGLLAAQMLEKHPGAKIIHDPRLTWNTVDMVKRAGGVPIESKTGHAFIKERMRAEDAIYGGEMSAHHYFREFAYCDSGMIPWLLVAERVSRTGVSLAQMLFERMAAYPCSGEINFIVEDAKATVARVLAFYEDERPELEYIDGVSATFPDWRFNLRSSNTEPLLRLNVEARGDSHLMLARTEQISALIRNV